MSAFASFGSLFLLVFLTSLRAYGQPPNYVYHICQSTTTTYNRISTYFKNLNTLLSALSSNSAFFSIGFQSTAKGQNPDTVFGLFLCRGDISAEVCGNCIFLAVNDTLSRCPEKKEAIIWYDECMVRYADRNIFLDPVTTNGIALISTENVTEKFRDRMHNVRVSLLNKCANEAANSSRKFAVNKSNFTSFQTLYGMAQCTADLTNDECLRCVQQTINQLPVDKIGGRFLWPSCYSRFEMYPFYNETLLKSLLV